jgi:hypothetical protein
MRYLAAITAAMTLAFLVHPLLHAGAISRSHCIRRNIRMWTAAAGSLLRVYDYRRRSGGARRRN